MKASSAISMILTFLFGAIVSQVIIPKFLPFLLGTGWDWAVVLVCSGVMYLLSRGWLRQVRQEGKMQERYK